MYSFEKNNRLEHVSLACPLQNAALHSKHAILYTFEQIYLNHINLFRFFFQTKNKIKQKKTIEIIEIYFEYYREKLFQMQQHATTLVVHHVTIHDLSLIYIGSTFTFKEYYRRTGSFDTSIDSIG